jgi:lipooligosaccharide transport system ATP-binding protein
MSGDAEPLVLARGLTKRFGSFTAVDGIDVSIQPGEAFGFLGPNGAGKSSTMRMVGCVSRRSEGTLSVFGLDPDTHGSEIRARLGVVPQEDSLDVALSVRDNLVVYARFFGVPRAEAGRRADELLEFAQLSDRAGDMVEPLSGGMKRRLTIARALVNRPELVLLDEPTTGLDPQARHLLWERLYRLKQDGATLVLTTHYMDEAEQLCDRLVIMDGGRIVDEGSPRSLIEAHCTREVLELRFGSADELEKAGAVLAPTGHRVETLPDRLLVYADDGDRAAAEVAAAGLGPTGSLVRRSTLEDVFLTLTGRTLVDS